MHANKIRKNYFVGHSQVRSVRPVIEAGRAVIRIELADGEVMYPLAASWVDGVTFHNTLKAGPVRQARRVELKAAIKERQGAREGAEYVGLVTTRRV
jgi:hypothetical protein